MHKENKNKLITAKNQEKITRGGVKITEPTSYTSNPTTLYL